MKKNTFIMALLAVPVLVFAQFYQDNRFARLLDDKDSACSKLESKVSVKIENAVLTVDPENYQLSSAIDEKLLTINFKSKSMGADIISGSIFEQGYLDEFIYISFNDYKTRYGTIRSQAGEPLELVFLDIEQMEAIYTVSILIDQTLEDIRYSQDSITSEKDSIAAQCAKDILVGF